jgi:acyl-[acyl-carrier-protein]-phospholipid O-acyltransferase/long-chain-fatty-acid--[acyl-carrier-protein] ligase
VSNATEEKEPGKREWMSFWALVGMQSTNAFNDNFAKFILIPLGVALAGLGLAPKGMEYILGLLMVLPFILFAPTAGWLADRFAKHRVIRWSSWFQLFVLGMMGAALWVGTTLGKDHSMLALVVVLAAFFLLATQSALLSPAKMGVVKELVGSNRLGFANGVMEGTVILAILLGQIIGGVWFDKWGIQQGLDSEPWKAAMIPILWILIGAIISLILCHLIQPTKPQGATTFSKGVVLKHFSDLMKVRQDLPLWRSTKGIAFFWGFGGFLQLLLIQIAQERKGSFAGMGVETALLWTPVVVGIVVGSISASLICARRNELGLIPVGGVMMTMGMLALAFTPAGWSVNILLGLSGCGAAMFLVPLNAYQQDRAPNGERGLVISASNLCTNLAGVFAVGLQYSLKTLGVPSGMQFIFIAVICGWATIYIMRLLPRDFVRLIVLGVFRSIYKLKVKGVDKIPREGGVLLVSNHLSYIDAIVLSAACPRPIRFLMFADCFERKWIGKMARFFDTVPITPSKAKDAIRVASDALNEGAVVCIFPEGQLSRTGGVSELKRGYQMIAKRAKCPILPAYMDGLWGSVWSFAEGNFLKKHPRTLQYGLNVAFGDLMDPKDDLAGRLRDLSVITATEREKRFRPKTYRKPKSKRGLPPGYSGILKKCRDGSESARQMRVNALQLGQVNIASRRSRMLVEWRDGDLSGILGILWPTVIRARVNLVHGTTDGEIFTRALKTRSNCVILHGAEGRNELIGKLRRKKISVWSFDEKASSDGEVFGCLVKEGRVVSFAIPDPDYETTTQMPQTGWKEDSAGKLLPGFSINQGRISGPAFSAPVEIKAREIDEEGFLKQVNRLTIG